MTENIDSDDSAYTESHGNTFVPMVECEERGPRRDIGPGPPCDACEIEYHEGLHDVQLDDDAYNVCEDCLAMLEDEINRYFWWELLSEAHYDRAAEYLRSPDEVWCVKADAYAGGELWVHTPFCHAGVVNDVCDHFGFRIRWFSVVVPGDPGFDCVEDHGPCIEINLEFTNRVAGPLPLEADIGDRSYSDVEWLEPHHELFERRD